MSAHRILFEIPEERIPVEREALWLKAGNEIEHCQRCVLAKTRQRTVFGEGPHDARLMFIGEAPGADEDEQGRPFVGRAGQLLTQILEAAGIPRDQVFITNVVKCRPPNNRVPAVEEMLACDPFLSLQIALLRPAIIVLLGSTPTHWILKTNEGISNLRGRWFKWKGVDVMPMFHPSYLLRNQSSKVGSPKHLTWLDIQEVKKRWDQARSTTTSLKKEGSE